jgi:hypothetical protein
MSKQYSIEGNIDFYNEINSNDDNFCDLNYDNICLITNESLIDKFVTLECGHKFNYIPLYNDLIKQKYFTNIMEESRLKINEIRCPYCRSVSTQLIPFYENFCIIKDVFVRKVIGVNLKGNIENLHYNYYNREKSLWDCEKFKIKKYTKQQINYDIKEAKLKAKVERLKIKEAKTKATKEAKEKEKEAKAKLAAKEVKEKEKLEAKEAKIRAKKEAKLTKVKTKSI